MFVDYFLWGKSRHFFPGLKKEFGGKKILFEFIFSYFHPIGAGCVSSLVSIGLEVKILQIYSQRTKSSSAKIVIRVAEPCTLLDVKIRDFYIKHTPIDFEAQYFLKKYFKKPP